MFSRIRARLTYANVMSTLAGFFSLGASAYAVTELTGADIKDESLTGADVKGINGTSTVKGVNGSLTGADVSGQPPIASSGQPAVNGSLTGYDIQDRSVFGIDLKNDTLTGNEINESTLGKVPDADKLDGLDANGLAGVASATPPEGGYAPSGEQVVQTVSLTAPRPGFVTLLGTATGVLGPCPGFCAFHARFRDTADDTDHGWVSDGYGSGRSTLNPMVTLPVEAGTHTWNLIGSWFISDGTTASWTNTRATAIFTPFDATGPAPPAATTSSSRAPAVRDTGPDVPGG